MFHDIVMFTKTDICIIIGLCRNDFDRLLGEYMPFPRPVFDLEFHWDHF